MGQDWQPSRILKISFKSELFLIRKKRTRMSFVVSHLGNILSSHNACLWYEHHCSFCVFGVASQMNPFSSNNSNHTSCIHNGMHAGKWPDLMTSQPDCVNTLGHHWTDHTGTPLEPQVHWDATGTHWLMLAPSGVPVAIQC